MSNSSLAPSFVDPTTTLTVSSPARSTSALHSLVSTTSFIAPSFDSTSFACPLFAQPTLFTPICQLSLAILSLHFALHCPTQQCRFVLYLSFLYFAVLSFLSSTELPDTFLASLWAQSMVLNIVHITSVFFLEANVSGLLETQKEDKSSCLTAKSLIGTYRLWANPQILPRAPKPKEGRQRDGTPVTAFLFLRLTKLALLYLMHTRVFPLYLSVMLPPSPYQPHDLVPRRLLAQVLIDRQPRDIVLRSYTAVSWIWESLVFLDGANAALSIVFVATGMDQPDDWPSLFGSVSNIRGLRSFWAEFWHRLAARPYKNFGNVVARGVVHTLRVQHHHKTTVRNVTVAFVVFILSGLSHGAVSWRLGMRDWLDVHWFLLNFAGCLAETAVRSIVRLVAARCGLQRELRVVERSWLGRVIGCTWVFGFFFWSVPIWRYPRMAKAYQTPILDEKKARILTELLRRAGS